MTLHEKILEALKQVDDPDLKRDIVSLNMVQELQVEGQKVHFRLVLTTPACPLKEVIKNACITAIHHLVDKNLEVSITLDAKVTTPGGRASLGGIRNMIAVASGKGGVGKSTVATNLAVSLAKTGAKVGLLDADIYGPSLPTMLNLRGKQPDIRKEGAKLTMIPFEQYGIKAMSIGLLINEKQALVWRGPMITTALRQLVNDVEWGELDYLIIDMPPGTGDIYLTLAKEFPLTAAVIVTTPQLVSVADTRKSIEMFNMQGIDIPVIGIIENMSYFVPAENPDKRYYLFGQGGGEVLANEYNLPLLAQLPLVQQAGEMADRGEPMTFKADGPLQTEFIHLAEKIAQHISILNDKGPKNVS